MAVQININISIDRQSKEAVNSVVSILLISCCNIRGRLPVPPRYGVSLLFSVILSYLPIGKVLVLPFREGR